MAVCVSAKPVARRVPDTHTTTSSVPPAADSPAVHADVCVPNIEAAPIAQTPACPRNPSLVPYSTTSSAEQILPAGQTTFKYGAFSSLSYSTNVGPSWPGGDGHADVCGNLNGTRNSSAKTPAPCLVDALHEDADVWMVMRTSRGPGSDTHTPDSIGTVGRDGRDRTADAEHWATCCVAWRDDIAGAGHASGKTGAAVGERASFASNERAE